MVKSACMALTCFPVFDIVCSSYTDLETEVIIAI